MDLDPVEAGQPLQAGTYACGERNAAVGEYERFRLNE
jgi:hypothetical protein